MRTRVPPSEFETRLSTVRDRLASADADVGLWFGATAIEYLTGFAHIQTERPVALAVGADRSEVVVPRLEVERVGPNPRIDAVHHYRDYPGGDPMGTVVAMLADFDPDRVVADAEGPPGTMGYEGPTLAEAWAGEPPAIETQSWVDRLRWTKSDAEVDLLATSARWANLGQRYLADHTAVGAHPATVGQRASTEASRAMLDTLGEDYVPRTRGTGPVHAGYISGSQTRFPHGHTANRRLSPGDVIVTGATAAVDGYGAELERTMILGEPDERQRHYFELAREAQELAIEVCGPGVELAAVDRAVAEYFAEHDVADLAHHHVGHNIGLDGHEPPYLDRGWTAHCGDDATATDPGDATMEPGHVLTIEPGLYTDAAGYRHSDTVAITGDGVERLTTAPRSLAANTIRVS